ncbi:MAG: hypothetical protein AAGA56_26165 [Myxococcota bacterium]
MLLARVLVHERATPRVGLVVDGHVYDANLLEEQRGSAWADVTAYFRRVMATQATGLDEVELRLRMGERPSEARLKEADYLPLPPFDGDRSLLIRDGTGGAVVEDARSAIGHGQPVPLAGGVEVHVSLHCAWVVSEELHRAERGRAQVFARTLVLRWTSGNDVRCQVGAWLAVGTPSFLFEEVEICVEAGSRSLAVASPSERAVAHALARVSVPYALRPGDVVALAPLAELDVSWGQQVSVRRKTGEALLGWAVRDRTE